MMPAPQTAMVLAAGLGTRMRPLTDTLPKPLIKVAGKALIDHALDRFAAAGVSRAVVNVHYLADLIETHLRRRATPEILISDERSELLETGGGLVKARSLLGAAPIYCTNTDAILRDGAGPEPCRALADAFAPATMDALLLLTPKTAASGYDGRGDFDLAADGRLVFRQGDAAPYIFTGLQILSPTLFADAPEGPFSTRRLWDKANAEGRLFGLVHEDGWMHVGDPQGLADAEAILAGHGRCR